MNSLRFQFSHAADRRHWFSKFRVVTFALLATCCSASFTHAATVTGRVLNQATRDLLAGAVVQVEGTSVSTTTERGGTFSLAVPEGARVLVVSYAGLDTARVPINVEAGRENSHEIGLTSGIYVLDAFAVKGDREGRALAIQLQRQSPNAKLVVAADTFGIPAANPGELLQRLPGISTEIVGSEVRTINVRGLGPGFSQLMVDGEKMASSSGTSALRDYQIEQLGTGNLESVELIKAPKPEDDASAVAGFINLVSRRGFDAAGRRITLTVGTMWRDRSFSNTPFKDKADGPDIIGLSYSDVFSLFGRKNNLGVALNINRRKSATTQDEIGPGGVFYTAFGQAYLNATSANPLTRVFGTGDFGYPATSLNTGLNLDYKLGPDSFVYVKFVRNHNDQIQHYLRTAVGDPVATTAHFTPDSTYEHSFFLPHTQASPNFPARTESSDFTKKAINFNMQLGSEHKLFSNAGVLSLRGTFSRANINYPAWHRIEAAITQGVGFEIDRRGQDPWYPIFRQTAGPALADPNNWLMRTYTRQNYKAPDELYTVRADYRHNFTAAVPVWIKAGLKHQNDKRKQRTTHTAQTWGGADGVPLSGDDAMTPYTAFNYRQGDGRYGPFPYLQIPNSGGPSDPAGAQNFWRQNALDAYNSYVISRASDAEFREQISAGYIQGNMSLGKLRVLAGVRVEETEVTATAWRRNATAAAQGNALNPTSFAAADIAENLRRAENSFRARLTNTGEYRNVFPGVHFIYEPWQGLLVRTSYNKSLSRPPVGNLLPTVTEDLNGDIVTGNPNLRPYTSDNFELGFEKYFEPVGVFSAGVFLKEIKDYFRSFSDVVPPEGIDGTGLYAGKMRSMVQNIGNARVRGFEMNYHQQFSFLPGFWKGFGVNANYTYTSAKGNFGTLTTTSRLPNMAPRTYNAGISYTGHGLKVNVLGNWTAQKYKGTSTVDIYNESRRFFDVKVQYAINRTYSLFLDAINITDEPPRTDASLNGLKFFKTNQGVSFTAGINARY